MMKIVKGLIGTVVIGAVIVGIVIGAEMLVQWLEVDKGRELLGIGIGAYAIYRLFKAEFGE